MLYAYGANPYPNPFWTQKVTLKLYGPCPCPCSASAVFLHVRPGNTAAIALYRAVGFVPIAVVPRYYDTPGSGGLSGGAELQQGWQQQQQQEQVVGPVAAGGDAVLLVLPLSEAAAAATATAGATVAAAVAEAIEAAVRQAAAGVAAGVGLSVLASTEFRRTVGFVCSCVCADRVGSSHAHSAWRRLSRYPCALMLHWKSCRNAPCLAGGCVYRYAPGRAKAA